MLGIEPRVSSCLAPVLSLSYTPAPKRGFLRQEDGAGKGGLSLQVEVRVAHRVAGGRTDRQTRCQGNKEKRLAREEGPTAQSTQSFSYIPYPV